MNKCIGDEALIDAARGRETEPPFPRLAKNSVLDWLGHEL